MTLDKNGNVLPYPPLPRWLRIIGLIIAAPCILAVLPIALVIGLILLPIIAIDQTFPDSNIRHPRGIKSKPNYPKPDVAPVGTGCKSEAHYV